MMPPNDAATVELFAHAERRRWVDPFFDRGGAQERSHAALMRGNHHSGITRTRKSPRVAEFNSWSRGPSTGLPIGFRSKRREKGLIFIVLQKRDPPKKQSDILGIVATKHVMLRIGNRDLIQPDGFIDTKVALVDCQRVEISKLWIRSG